MTSAAKHLSSPVKERENPSTEISPDTQQLLDAYNYWAHANLPSEGSRWLYANKLQMFTRFLGEQDPKALEYGPGGFLNLNAGHVRAYMYYLDTARKLSGATQLSHRGAVRSFCKFLTEDGYLKVDPFVQAKIPRPKADDVLVPILPPTDFEALRTTALKDKRLGRRDIALIDLLASTGLRISEACDLTLDDLNTRDGVVTVRHGKGNKARPAGVEEMAMRSLMRYLEWRKQVMRRRPRWSEPCDRLFVTQSGNPLLTETVRNRFKELARRAGLDPRTIHPHVFRHMSATMSADAGMTPNELNSMYGWSRDSGMSERYTRSSVEQRAIASHRAIRPLERALGKRS